MRTTFRLFLMVAAVDLLLRCASTEPYPDGWSPHIEVSPGECADIGGIFKNACTPKTEYDDNCLGSGGLAGLLFAKYAGSFHLELASADRVAIHQPESHRLLVEAWDGFELVQERELLLNPEDCTEEGVLISSGLKGTQIEGGIGTGSSRAVLAKNEDGDLVANLKARFTGVWFIVPVSGSDQHWKRFERTANQEDGDP